jgi:large subunit ribosomal protein L22
MPSRAQVRFVQISATKARRVMNLIRGRNLREAEAILDLTGTPTARQVRKLVDSAAANAENNHAMEREFLWVSQAYVDEGPSMRRLRPASQGRISIIRRPTSHMTVVLDEREELKRAAAERRARPRRRRAARTRRAEAPQAKE